MIINSKVNNGLAESCGVYGSDAQCAAFLLGGIGTGNFSIGSRGEFRDWEIFNSPNKGNFLPYTFSAIWVKSGDAEPLTRVLESRIVPPFDKAHGFDSDELAGLPRLDSSTMTAKYPFLTVAFEDRLLPVQVFLEAFTPFIPLNAEDSGIPSAIIRYKVHNPGPVKADVSIAFSLANVIKPFVREIGRKIETSGGAENLYRESGNISGLFYTSDYSAEEIGFGNIALVTTDKNVSSKPLWIRGGWFDGAQDFWDDFSCDGKLTFDKQKSNPQCRMNVGKNGYPPIGSLSIHHTIEPGETKIFEYVLAWYFPNRPNDWNGHIIRKSNDIGNNIDKPNARNYYSKLFSDAWDVANYIVNNMGYLENKSRDFTTALYSSTLPHYVIEALANNITVLRSTTCFRLENGFFLAWEGCAINQGCCEGSCTHVWNYAQTLAFLFPELEQIMRQIEFNLETDECGSMAFRTNRVFGGKRWSFVPAADGQMGTIIRLYRDWKISGNDEFLRSVWSKASAALDFAFTYWDTDGDCVLDGEQHNTYDIEFHGVNSLTNSMFFAALKAGHEMARYLGDEERAEKYLSALTNGSKKMDNLLWNGQYYGQHLEDVNEHPYQYGFGCLSDQLIGQWLAHVAGLGYVLPKKHVKTALQSIFANNFKESFLTHHSVQRTFALNDERGLVLCSWPLGGRPDQPFPYSDEVWTGVEYQVAAHMIYEGFVDEGLTLVQAVRERHDGYRRNPWNEVECGNHYARSLASWSLLTALSGFSYDLVAGKMGFQPKINNNDFRCFWSNGRAWGIYKQTIDVATTKREFEIEVLYGDLDGVTINPDDAI